MTANRVIGVDLGGTKVLAGVVDAQGRVHETVERPTVTTSQAALLDELASLVAELPQDDVTAVGFGIPSRIDHERGIALGAVNIPIRDVSFIDEMTRRVGLPVEMENDASCAAYAEFKLGAGRGVRDLLTLTLGTGVGRTDDKLDREVAAIEALAQQWAAEEAAKNPKAKKLAALNVINNGAGSNAGATLAKANKESK